ncbi:hypothetical protein PO909_004820 [Leuciscus waleckii]
MVSGQMFRAHKNILVAGSRYFKTLYCLTKSESCDQTTITHLDVAAVQGFSVILDFLYSGNLFLTSQNAIEVMSVASYLQMTEVVQSCRAFIKDALNISIKQEAPDSVNSSESTEMEPQGPGPVFIWNGPNPGTGVAIKREDRPEPGSRKRKKQAAKRFVYNIPPEPEEGFDEGMFIQPSASYTRGEAPENALNKLKCPHCNYIAKHRRTLKRHLIIHSGVRSFSCDICGKLFTRREHVKRHSLVCMYIYIYIYMCVCEGLEGMQDLEFARDEDFDEAVEGDEDMEAEEGEPNEIDQSNCEGDAGAIPEKD